MTDSRSWRGTAVLAVLATGLQLYGLYRVPGPPSPPWFAHADKLQHAVGFALPVGLLLVAAGRRSAARDDPRPPPVVGVSVVFAVHAVLSEVVQHLFYTSRTGDPLDVLADWCGIGAGVLGGRWWLRRHRSRAAPR